VELVLRLGSMAHTGQAGQSWWSKETAWSQMLLIPETRGQGDVGVQPYW
jgi:hypothetical protein